MEKQYNVYVLARLTLCFLIPVVPERFSLSSRNTILVALFHAPLNNVPGPTLGLVGGVTIVRGVLIIKQGGG